MIRIRQLAGLIVASATALTLGLASTTATAQAPGARKPNVLVIWGDDIGQFNLSA